MGTRLVTKPLILTPSMLKTFQQCPHQYQMKYVDRVRVDEGFNPALERGNVVHAILDIWFRRFASDRSFPINVRERIENHLPRDKYPDERAWAYDVDIIERWVLWVLGQFDGDCTILATEQFLNRRVPETDACPSWVLKAKIDQIREWSDGTLEILDFKSGKGSWVDSIQNVAMRVIVAKAYPGRTVWNTVMFLETGRIHSEVLGREYIQEVGDEIKRLAKAIHSETEWLPIANNLCDYCPFISTCPLYAGDSVDEDDDWLDEVA